MEKFVARMRGFTLIELIIVIAIIAIIVAAVFVAMDPVKRLNASRNARRSSDATAIASAFSLAATDRGLAGQQLAAFTVLRATSTTTPNATTFSCIGPDGCVGDWFMIGGSQDPSASPYVSNAATSSACHIDTMGPTTDPNGALGFTNTTTSCGGVQKTLIRNGCISLQQDLISGYLSSIPRDPVLPSASIPSGYLVQWGSGAVWVRNCKAEPEGAGGTGTPPPIQVSR